ncbi:MAG: hypothetical protein AAFX50_09080 [Acidobacteriota bacterium]
MTMRSKTEYLIEKRPDRRSGEMRTVIEKVGLKPDQREGFEYEFDIWGEMSMANEMTITKSRCPELNAMVIDKPGDDVAETLHGWLDGAPWRTTAEMRKLGEAMTRNGVDRDAVAAYSDETWQAKPRGLTVEQLGSLMAWVEGHATGSEAQPS